jgi:putative ABC transport system permease protein
MLSNYLKIAVRNLIKNKLFSVINISGMAISLAACLLIALFAWDELRYDDYHPDGDRTFRVYNIVDHAGVKSYRPIVPYPFAIYMQKDFPEVESTLRFLANGEELFEHGDKRIQEGNSIAAESTVFEMLSIRLIEGDAATALANPNVVALSETLAKKYFGSEPAVGKNIKIDKREYEVTAVFADLPSHSHLKINCITSLSSVTWAKNFDNNWQRQEWYTYVKLKPGADVAAFESKLKPMVEKYAYPTIEDKGFTYVPHVQNIHDIHLHSSNFEWEFAERGDAQSVYILLGSALMILVIACLNFINLSTARAVKRIKEVGVRKVTGALKSQLIFQFITESVLITMFGMLLAIVIAEVTLPATNAIVEKQLSLPYDISYILCGLIFCLVLGAAAGSYPAFKLSSFRPAIALAGKNGSAGGLGTFRQSLVAFQFMLSFFLITASWIVLSQNELISNKNLGFNKEQIIVVPLTGPQLKHVDATKAKYKDNPNVINATIGFGLPGDIIAGDEIIEPTTNTTMSTSLFCVDYDYLKTMGMTVVAGRDFSAEYPTDSADAFILNETAAKTFGLGTPEEAVGKSLDWNRWDRKGIKHGKVIGVVRDFHFKSLRDKVSPTVLQIWPANWKLAARVRPENLSATIEHFKKTYESLDPEWAFSYSFLDQKFDAMYKSEQRLGKMFSAFTYLGILIACLGLFGLVEYSVNQRAREISIRKVFGASVNSLLVLLTRKYFTLVMIAFVVVIPLSYYAAGEWLNNFAYRIDISPWMYAKACATVLAITILTVSFQSLKAAWANPAKILRSE